MDMTQYSKLPYRHRRKRLPDNNGPWRAVFERLRAATGYLAILCGDRGVGKTQLSTWVAMAKLKDDDEAIIDYRKAYDFFAFLKAGFSPGHSEEDQINKVCSPSLLIVDGLEELAGSVYELRILSHVIDRRYDTCKSSILITNHKIDKLSEHLGTSILSRAIETGFIEDCAWEPFRK